MVQSATLVVDDQDSLIHYLCPSLSQKVLGSYYNNTWSTVESETCGKGWFEYTFYGTGINVAASIAHPAAGYSVKLDDGAFESQSGNGSYSSPILQDGKHTFIYATDAVKSFPSFDYLTVAAGPSTPLYGQTLAVDDTDDLIKYTGNWSTTAPIHLAFDYSTSLYGNGAHWTSTVGDSLEFQFTGTSISVFGIVANVSSSGNITATYTLDGVSSTRSIPQGTLNSLPMVKLFQADFESGDHTLSINLTDIKTPQAIGIDLVTYNSSLRTLAPISAPSTGTQNGSHSIHPGVKIGIVVGILVAAALLASLVFLLWRRHSLQKSKNIKDHLSRDSDSEIYIKRSSKLTW